MDHPLAHRAGIGFMALYLSLRGATCPKCGYGTRATSKRWARCKRDGCDGRAERRTDEEVRAMIRERLESAPTRGESDE